MRRDKILVRTSTTTRRGGILGPRCYERDSRDVSMLAEFVRGKQTMTIAQIRVGNGSGASERSTIRGESRRGERRKERKTEKEGKRERDREKRRSARAAIPW